MAKKILKRFFRIFEFILAFIIILSLLLFIRLKQGPIQIKNLTPIIIETFTSEEKDTQVQIQNAYLELALSRGRLMDVRLEDLNLSDKENCKFPAFIHSPVPGKVLDIYNVINPNGKKLPAILIKMEGVFSFSGKKRETLNWTYSQGNSRIKTLSQMGVINTFEKSVWVFVG